MWLISTAAPCGATHAQGTLRDETHGEGNLQGGMALAALGPGWEAAHLRKTHSTATAASI